MSISFANSKTRDFPSITKASYKRMKVFTEYLYSVSFEHGTII